MRLSRPGYSASGIAGCVMLGVWLMGTCSAWAQPAPGAALERFERRLEQIRRDTRLRVDEQIPVERRARFDYGGYLSQNFIALDDTGGETHILRQTDLTLYGRANVDNVHRFLVRGRVQYEDFNSGDDFDGEGDEWIGPELERAIYRFDLARALEAYEGESPDWNLQLEAGRQLVDWANGLTLSTEIDGIRATATVGPFEAVGLAGRSYEEQVDIDSSRPDFDDEMNRNFFGGMLRYKGIDNHTPYVYGLVQEDRNDDDVLRVGPTSTAFEYDSHYIGGGMRGTIGQDWRYGVEAVYQGGEGKSFNVNNASLGGQTTEDIEAWALDVRGEYLVGDDANTRFSGELILASGDDDRAFHTTNTFGGNQPGTDDEAFNGFGLLNTGYAFGPNPSNLAMIRLGASSYPLHTIDLFSRLQLGTDVFIYNKLDQNAPIDEPTMNESFLGVETDFYANWQITSDLSAVGRYGVFFPGDAFNDSDARHFFYSGMTLAF